MPKGSDLPRLLVVAVLQASLVAVLAGGILGLLLWRSAVQDFDKAIAVERVCPKCADTKENNCSVVDLDDYHNPRLVPLPVMFTPEEGKWIIKHSKIGSSPVVFSRHSRSWAWIYGRIHNAVIEQNLKQWQFGIPQDPNSDLVEDIHLVAYSNTSSLKPWTCDIGSMGGIGKRVLSATVALNSDFEGGDTLTQIARDEYVMQATPGMLWIINSFVIQKRTPITEGVQYALHYYVRRY